MTGCDGVSICVTVRLDVGFDEVLPAEEELLRADELLDAADEALTVLSVWLDDETLEEN